MTDGIARFELAVWCENGHPPERADEVGGEFVCRRCETTYEADVSFEVDDH